MKQFTTRRIVASSVSCLLALSLACCTDPAPSDTPETGTDSTEVMCEFFVSSDGNDSNDGLSPENPFATLERAQSAIREINGDMTGDIIVNLADGTWELSKTISFGKADSGTNGYNVIYAAADGASPVLSGGQKLDTDWEIDKTLKNGNIIYKTRLDRDSKLRALYVNGERRYMASTGSAIEAKGSWGSYTIGSSIESDDFEWVSVYSENFDSCTDVSELKEIVAWSKSGRTNGRIINIADDGSGRSLAIVHTADEDCGFEIPDATYENGLISFKIMLADDHIFSHGWEALHIHGANKLIDKNGRTSWAGIALAPQLNQAYFQSGTSGGGGSDDVSSPENISSLSMKNGTWYHVKMMVTKDGSYYSKMWKDGDAEPSDWERRETFGSASSENFLRIYAYKNNSNSQMNIRIDDIEIKSGTLKNTSSGSGLPEWAWVGGTKFDGIKYGKGDLVKITRNVEDVEIENQQTWNKNIVCVREIESGSDGTWILKLQQPYGAIAQTPGWGVGLQGYGNHIISNAYELLDEKGEFYFDKAEKLLYYIPADGEDINSASFVVPRLETIVEFKGTPVVSGDLTTAGEKTIEGQVKNIVFDGITVAHSDYNLQKVGDSYGKSTVQAGTVYTAYASDNWHADMYRNLDTLPGAVEMEFAHNITFANGGVILTGAEGILLSNDVDGCKIIGNYIYQTGGGGVVVGNPQHIYENDSLEPDVYAYRVGNGNTYIISDGAGAEHEKYQNGTERVPRNVTVSENLLLENCRLFPSHCPVTLFFTQNTEVSHNFIKDASYSGISAGWGWCNFDGKTSDFKGWGTANNQGGSVLPGYPTSTCFGNKIVYNRIENAMTILADGGLIYTLGEQRDTLIVGNFGKDSEHGLYQDEGSALFADIENNVIADVRDSAIFAVSYGRKHDLTYIGNYSNSDSVAIAPDVNITSRKFRFVQGNMWPRAASEIIQQSGLSVEYRAKFSDILIEIEGDPADAVLIESVFCGKGNTLVINSWLDESCELWIAPLGTKTFTAGDKMTTAPGNAYEIKAPTTSGVYKLYVKTDDGEIFMSTASIRVN